MLEPKATKRMPVFSGRWSQGPPARVVVKPSRAAAKTKILTSMVFFIVFFSPPFADECE
jgi:hypothetical protein